MTWKSMVLPVIVATALCGCSSPPKSSTDATAAERWPFISIQPPGVLTPPVGTNVPPTAQLATNLPPPSVTASPAVKVDPPVPTIPPARVISYPTWVSWTTWSEANGWGKPQRVRNVPTYTFELQGPGGVLQLTAGVRTALWNGLNLELGFIPRLTNSQAYIHALDATKTFQPLTAQPALFHRTSRSIVLDPGHGGENYGAKSALGNQHEKDFALDWAVRLERLLVQRGWKVYLTRTNDVDISLADRIAFADRVQGDLFVSLHFNSTDQPQGKSDQGGMETYTLTPVGMPSSMTRQFEDEANHLYPNNAFDAENYWVAAKLHRAVVEATRRKDRGVRRARFMGVLRGQNRPAVLLEAGYLTYPSEARLIGQSEYRQKLAEAVAKALCE